MRTFTWINFILGLWLIVAGFVLSAGAGPIMTEEIVLGIIIACLASVSATRPHPAVSWLVALAGLWTLLAPTFISYVGRGASRTNDVIVGIVVLIIGAANAISSQTPVRTAA